MKPAFIPLKKRYYEQFLDGSKTIEYRIAKRQWRAKNFPVGRPVILSSGYGKKHRTEAIVLSSEECPFERLCRLTKNNLEECCGRIEPKTMITWIELEII